MQATRARLLANRGACLQAQEKWLLALRDSEAAARDCHMQHPQPTWLTSHIPDLLELEYKLLMRASKAYEAVGNTTRALQLLVDLAGDHFARFSTPELSKGTQRLSAIFYPTAPSCVYPAALARDNGGWSLIKPQRPLQRLASPLRRVDQAKWLKNHLHCGHANRAVWSPGAGRCLLRRRNIHPWRPGSHVC